MCLGCPDVAASCQGHSWCLVKIPSKSRVSLLHYMGLDLFLRSVGTLLNFYIVGIKPEATVIKNWRAGENVG